MCFKWVDCMTCAVFLNKAVPRTKKTDFISLHPLGGSVNGIPASGTWHTLCPLLEALSPCFTWKPIEPLDAPRKPQGTYQNTFPIGIMWER